MYDVVTPGAPVHLTKLNATDQARMLVLYHNLDDIFEKKAEEGELTYEVTP